MKQDIKQNKVNIFLLITTIFSTLILLIGATFSYFSTRNMSKMNALAVEAGKVRLGLSVSALSTGHKLIPTNDSDIMTAYKQNCIDDYGNGACSLYEFEVYNFNKSQDVIGKIDFNVSKIENLSYMILDENDNVYLSKTSVPNGETKDLPLGEHFLLGEATELSSTSRKFKLIIWLTNLEEDQNDIDAGGCFSAVITFSSVTGGRLTATVEGYEDSGNNISRLGGV